MRKLRTSRPSRRTKRRLPFPPGTPKGSCSIRSSRCARISTPSSTCSRDHRGGRSGACRSRRRRPDRCFERRSPCFERRSPCFEPTLAAVGAAALTKKLKIDDNDDDDGQVLRKVTVESMTMTHASMYFLFVSDWLAQSGFYFVWADLVSFCILIACVSRF